MMTLRTFSVVFFYLYSARVVRMWIGYSHTYTNITDSICSRKPTAFRLELLVNPNVWSSVQPYFLLRRRHIGPTAHPISIDTFP